MKTSDSINEERGFPPFGGAGMTLPDTGAGFWSIRRHMEALIGLELTNSVLQQAGANGGASFAGTFGSAEDASDQERYFNSFLRAYQTAGCGQFEVQESQWPLGQLTVRANDAFEARMTLRHGQQVDRPMCAYTAGVMVGFVNAICNRRDIVCTEQSCQAKGDESCVFELFPSSHAKNQTVDTLGPNRGLGRESDLLEILFERMPMGIAVFDRGYHFLRYNPTWGDFSKLYAPPSAAPLVPGVYYFDHLPGSEMTVIPLFERVLSGETVRQNGLRFESGGIVSFWDVVLAPLFERGKISGILNVTIDATERVLAQQNLEQRVEERTRQLRTLLQVSQDITSTLTLEPLLDLILEQLRAVVDYTGASILILESGALVMGAYRGPIPQKEAQHVRFPLEEALVYSQVIQQQEPLVIPDIRGDTPFANMFRQTAGGELESTLGYVRSWLGVPLRYKGHMLGLLTLDHSRPGFFTAQHADLIQVFANQVAIAIENARLYATAEDSAVAIERGRLARELHDAVTQTLFSASLIADVLPKLWERNPELGRQNLDELRILTRGALSEMRTLLLELRPTTLAEMDLGDLLRHLANAFAGRNRIPVDLTIDGNNDPTSEVKVVFYRVAQEALNNIHKHAEATQVSIKLQRTERKVQMGIRDNGRGFDIRRVLPDNMGLSIMQERAETIGAKLAIQSVLGVGTHIELFWKDESK